MQSQDPDKQFLFWLWVLLLSLLGGALVLFVF
jgi:hypothetical protein